MKKDLNYREDLKLDKYNLDEEIENQPIIFMDYAEAEAEAEYRMGRAKGKYNAVKAKVASEVRSDPVSWGWNHDARPTDTFIKECVDQDRRVRDAYKDFLKKQRTFKKLGHAVWAFVQRKEGLGYLSNLWAKQYYARPYVTQEAKEVEEQRSREAQENALLENRRLQRLAGGLSKTATGSLAEHEEESYGSG